MKTGLYWKQYELLFLYQFHINHLHMSFTSFSSLTLDLFHFNH